MKSEIGESSAAIRKRADDNAWTRVELALRSGATLYRPTKLRDYYTHCKNDRDDLHGISISAGRVKKLVEDGTLIRVGVDTYGLTGAQ